MDDLDDGTSREEDIAMPPITQKLDTSASYSEIDHISFDGNCFELNMNKTKNCNELLFKIEGTPLPLSNFQLHFKRKHGVVKLEQLDNHLVSKRASTEENNEFPEIVRMSSSTPSTSVVQETVSFKRKVYHYFLKSYSPFSALNLPEFWAMFDYFGDWVPRMTAQELTTKVQVDFEVKKMQIVKTLDSIDFVCTSLDLWTTRLHNYVAIACHWIDPVTFERKSVALACKCFVKTSIINITHVYNQTLIDYKLPMDKIIANVRNSCYNFSSYFKLLKNELKKDTIIETTISQFVEREPLPLSAYMCYTLALSLIPIIDVQKVIDSTSSLKPINESSLKKVFSFLSHAAISSDSTLAALLVDYKKPGVTKWDSIYDSIVFVLSLETNSFVKLFGILQIEPFTKSELKYLKEYLKCLGPLAAAIKRLECTYLGYVLPSLFEMRKKYEKLQRSKEIEICEPILKTLILILKSRFSELLGQTIACKDNCYIASLSHPLFKERWLNATDTAVNRASVRSNFIKTVSKLNSKLCQRVDVQKQEFIEQQIDEFYFGEENDKDKAKDSFTVSVELEALRYLADERKNLTMLEDYPTIKKGFLMYNCPLSSSEPVVKLFSNETRKTISIYGYLGESLFEERVLLVVNEENLLS